MSENPKPLDDATPQEAKSMEVLPVESGKFTQFVVDEPASFVGGIAPIALPTPPSFVTLATVSLRIDDMTDRVWLNATVGWYVDFTAPGTVQARFRLLRGTTVIYETQQVTSSTSTVPAPPPPTTVHSVAHLEHIDTTPITTPLPMIVTYVLEAQADVAGAFTGGPITLSAAEIERNVIA
ncbi:MAG TPA: hypothetical protein GX507_04415 [Clostridia bacterium]|nr:hypothetical protein [Clostridia bacterium]